jgi:peptidoglycan/xylan/chitin deacetylase (PgdA/CDA1 family)
MNRLTLWLFLVSCLIYSPAGSVSGTSHSVGKLRAVRVIPGVVYHGARKGKDIALTFDACSMRTRGRLDTAVARILIQTGTPATIFLGGKWASDVRAELRPLVADTLIEFGNHAYMHPHLLTYSSDSIRQELRKAQRAIKRATGKTPVLFRAPYGEVDARVDSVAESLGLTVIQYDLASGDPDSAISATALVRYVTSMAKGGSIVVMHINTRGWHTAEALPEIIAGLQKKGYRFVTVSRLLNSPPARPSPSRGTSKTGTQNTRAR